MGARCTLVVVDAGRVEVYSDRWAATTLGADLFWGPAAAVAFIRSRRGVTDGAVGWYDEVWAEGGAVVDLDRRRLLWFGGEDLRYDVRLRRLHHGLLRQPWAGYEVRYAMEGIAELADAAGVDRATVLDEPAREERPLDDPAELASGDGRTLITVRHPDGALRWACPASWTQEDLRAGEPLLAAARVIPHPTPARLSNAPGDGLHVDLGRRTIDAWTAADAPAMDARLARAYPGWTTTWHRDHFEAQLALADRVAWPPFDVEAALATLRASLLRAAPGGEDVVDAAIAAWRAGR